MTSKAQRLKGYPIPEDYLTEETQQLCLIIPAGEEFLIAAKSQLDLLGKWWNWKRDLEEEGSQRAKHTAETWRMLYTLSEDCGGLGMATQEDIAKGMYQAFNWLALQIASGSYSNLNISTDAEGVVTLPSGGDDGSLPEDDPETSYDDTKAARYGGAVSVMRGIEKLLDRIDTIYGSVNGTPVTPIATAQEQIKLQFPSDAALMDAAVSNYYSYRATEPVIQFNQSQANQLYFYCKGYNLIAWNNWLLESSGYNNYKISTVSKIVAALAPEFWESYFEVGAATPSSVYLEANCEPSPSETMILLAGATSYNGNTAWKPNHRLRFTVSGYFVDSSPTPKTSDFWWYSFPPSAPSNHVSQTNIQLGTGITKPTVNQVPYNGGHVYQFTIDTPAASGSIQITIPIAGMTAPITSPTGGITVLIEDLGEFIL